MVYEFFLVLVLCLFVFFASITVLRSIVVLKLRKEENRKRELELAILDKQSIVLNKKKELSSNLEELLYKANVQKEIENLMKKNDS